MKMYANVSSERASKGQGGNKYIEIILTVETENRRENVGRMLLEEHEGSYNLSYFSEADGEYGVIDTVEKGKRQQGEGCTFCRRVNCGGECED